MTDHACASGCADANGKKDAGGRLVLDFIDPLFAVVVHVSLVEGLAKTKWYDSWHKADSVWPTWDPTDWFNGGVFLLVYFIVVTSWIGYHKSVANSPIRLTTLPGNLRFALDILLLICYCAMAARFENFTFVLWTIVVVFVLFVLWDQAKRLEYPDRDRGDTARRRGVTIVWAIAYALVAVLGTWCWPRSPWILLVAVVFSIAYRWHKKIPWVPFRKLFCWPLRE